MLEKQKECAQKIIDTFKSDSIYVSLTIATLLQDRLPSMGKFEPHVADQLHEAGKPYKIGAFLSNEQLEKYKDFPIGFGLQIYVDPILHFHDTNIYKRVSEVILELDYDATDLI